MPANVTIRQAQKRDRGQIIPLAIELFGANNDPINRPLVKNYTVLIARSWDKVNFRKSCILVAEEGEKIVGYIKGWVHGGDPLYAYKNFALVEELVVHETSQRQGIGRELITAFEKSVSAKADRVMLSSDAHVTTRTFYEKVGYHVNSYRMLKVFR